MSSTEIGLVGGFFLGLLASYLVWIVVARVHLPRIQVSKISKQSASTSGENHQYRVKVRNMRRHRLISDLSTSCRLVIQGLNPERPSNFTSLRLPVADEHPFPVLEPRSGRIYTLRISELGGGGVMRLPPEAKRSLSSGGVELEDLLRLGSSAFLRLAISGAHELGGLRRTVNLRYGLDDIILGGFSSKNSVKIESSGPVREIDDDFEPPRGVPSTEAAEEGGAEIDEE